MTSWAAVCKKLFLGYRPHRFHDWLLWSVLDEILSCLVRTAFRVFSMVSTFSDRWWTHTCAHTLLQAADCRVWHYQPRQSECVRFFLLRWCWVTNHKPFKCCKVNVWLKKNPSNNHEYCFHLVISKCFFMLCDGYLWRQLCSFGLCVPVSSWWWLTSEQLKEGFDVTPPRLRPRS